MSLIVEVQDFADGMKLLLSTFCELAKESRSLGWRIPLKGTPWIYDEERTLG
jgi:hypothetical protein